LRRLPTDRHHYFAAHRCGSIKQICVFIACLIVPGVSKAQTAREYFNEMRAAHALNRYADEYVCFADDSIPSFAVIAKVNDLIEDMKKRSDTDGVKTLAQAKNGLIVHSYYKGVESGEGQIFDRAGSDSPEGSTYAYEFLKPFHGKASYSINWTTGRYRYQIFEVKPSYASPLSGERSGKCELIHPVKEEGK
jgi:hypothetical protein